MKKNLLKQKMLAVAAIATLLTGCGGVRWSVKGGCNEQDGCYVEGEISNKSYTGSTPDFSGFALDISGTSVSLPSSGNVLVTLVDSDTGITTAASSFGWTRSGDLITLVDSAAATSWAATNRASADSVFYQLDDLAATSIQSINTFSVTATWDNSPQASFSMTWQGGSGECPTCEQN